ncbi:unknown [Ruminococcus sp. CAG:382]|nr:unknown [Ruminococcus sp. CAG:382]
MQSETAGKQTVSVCDLDDIAVSCACCGESAGSRTRPDIDIVFGVCNDGGSACRTAGSMNTHELVAADGDEAERIVVAQVCLQCERQQRDIIDRFDIAGFYAHFIEFAFVKRNVIVCAFHGLYESFVLYSAELLCVGTLYILVENCHWVHLNSIRILFRMPRRSCQRFWAARCFSPRPATAACPARYALPRYREVRR